MDILSSILKTLNIFNTSKFLYQKSCNYIGIFTKIRKELGHSTKINQSPVTIVQQTLFQL